MNPYQLLKRPAVSEKSNERREEQGKYTFEVDKKASKLQIQSAVQKIYDVKVESVRTMIRRGKTKRRGKVVSQSRARKFAIVELAEGQKLPIFEES